MESAGSITDIVGVRVGHWTDREAVTGCTVVLVADGAVAGVDVRGWAPGARETDLLRPGMLVAQVHAVLLTGGSAFGLAAADGVMRFLEELGVGFDARVARVPIVPAAVLFDLGVGSAAVRPTAQSGYAACRAAGVEVVEGSVGAGTGATVAKLNGPDRAWKGGLGTASAVLASGARVGAIVAVNAVGAVVDERGAPIAAPRPGPTGAPSPLGNTTIAVVATDAALDKAQANTVAQMAQDGLALALRPAHTMFDGDTVFVVATGASTARIDASALSAIGAQAALTVAEAIRRGVRLAESLGGVPAVGAPGGA